METHCKKDQSFGLTAIPVYSDPKKTNQHNLPLQSWSEEIANTITHGIGLILSVIGFYVLLLIAIERGSAWHVIGCAVYGVSLIFLYTASTVYHSLRPNRLKDIFRIVDHSCIYLLIAGSYTPFTLTLLRGGIGWTLFALVWTLALVGISCKVFMKKRFEADVLSTMFYAVMGWLALVAIKPILATIPPGALWFLLGGGLCYTVGILFYAWDKRIRFFHTVWHVFVLAGSALHYFAIMYYVLPVAP